MLRNTERLLTTKSLQRRHSMATQDSRKEQSDDTAIVRQSFTLGSPELEIFLGVRSNCSRGDVPFGWKSFAKFLADVGRMPSADHTLELVDEGRGYAPGNVRWASMALATLVLFLTLGVSTFAGPNPKDFPLMVEATASDVSKTTEVSGYHLGQCFGDVCTSGYPVTHTSSIAMTMLTIDGDTYWVGHGVFRAGGYLGRIVKNGRVIEILCKQKGKLHVEKCPIYTVMHKDGSITHPQ